MDRTSIGLGVLALVLTSVLVYFYMHPVEKFANKSLQKTVIKYFNNTKKPRFSEYSKLVKKYNYPGMLSLTRYAYFKKRVPLTNKHFAKLA